MARRYNEVAGRYFDQRYNHQMKGVIENEERHQLARDAIRANRASHQRIQRNTKVSPEMEIPQHKEYTYKKKTVPKSFSQLGNLRDRTTHKDAK